MSNFTNSSTGVDVQPETGTIVFAIVVVIVLAAILILCIFRKRKAINKYVQLRSASTVAAVPTPLHYHEQDIEQLVFPLDMAKARMSGGVSIRWTHGEGGGAVKIVLGIQGLRQLEGFLDSDATVLLLTTRQPVIVHRPCHWTGGGRCNMGRVCAQRVNKPPFQPTRPEEWILLPNDTQRCSRNMTDMQFIPSVGPPSADLPKILPAPALPQPVRDRPAPHHHQPAPETAAVSLPAAAVPPTEDVLEALA